MTENDATLLDSMFGATELVDKALKDISGKSLVSAQEITDLLLDIRLYLVTDNEDRVHPPKGSEQVASSK